jgi:hypothetical protein
MAKKGNITPVAGKQYEHLVLMFTSDDVFGRMSTPEKPECPMQDALNQYGAEGYVVVDSSAFGAYIAITMAREKAE